MRAAFYAPLKPLDHPQPSGDREIGRLIKRALTDNGVDVEIASRLRSWMRSPDTEQYRPLKNEATREASGLIERWRPSPPDVWVTYHLYHKAPDWIGPAVSKALGIPYVAIEASRSLKRQNDGWAQWFEDADIGIHHADTLICFHDKDLNGLKTAVPASRLHKIAPFIDTELYRPRTRKPGTSRSIHLITVAMMREGDKAASYRCLAEALASLQDLDWSLTIIGDGPARANLEPLFPKGRCQFLGARSPEDIPDLLRQADLFIWPAINEAFGMVFLEAQAAGLPVLAGRTGGVPDIVRDGETGFLSAVGDADALAANLRKLISEPDTRNRLSHNAIDHIEDNHSLATTGRTLADCIKGSASV
ncbi:glycosyltransferase family 4 protein [Coralliovum pocilloporae]|uniref:glycosyltransferase family 4 protein n=1 Tax=Coralliovum pocilloporae TaxID=3066369 RepID=UPI003306DA11